MFNQKNISVEELRKKYPKGTVVVLEYMNDIQAPPVGTKGVVEYVDDAGGIHTRWETGCGLALLPEVDKFYILRKD